MAPNDFNWRIIDSIDRLIADAGLSRAEVIQRSGIRRNTFFVKMRGETALTTDDLSKIADALNISPDEIVAGAVVAPKDSNVSGRDDDVEEMSEYQEDYGRAARGRSKDRGLDIDYHDHDD